MGVGWANHYRSKKQGLDKRWPPATESKRLSHPLICVLCHLMLSSCGEYRGNKLSLFCEKHACKAGTSFEGHCDLED